MTEKTFEPTTISVTKPVTKYGRHVDIAILVQGLIANLTAVVVVFNMPPNTYDSVTLVLGLILYTVITTALGIYGRWALGRMCEPHNETLRETTVTTVDEAMAFIDAAKKDGLLK